MEDEAAAATALLHDIVEDTDYTLNDLKDMGFDDAIIEAVSVLTYDYDVPYMEYVVSIRSNPIAGKVKLADLRHNSDLTRFRYYYRKR